MPIKRTTSWPTRRWPTDPQTSCPCRQRFRHDLSRSWKSWPYWDWF